MGERLRRVEDALTELTTERKRLEAHRAEVDDEIADLEARAESALDDGDEDLARSAVAAKAEREVERDRIDGRIADVEAAEAELRESREDLERRVERFRTEKEAAKARRRAGAEPGGRGEEIDRAIERATDEVEGMEARSRALDELESTGALDGGGGSDDVDRELDAVSTESVDAELRRIRSELDDEGD
jgi:phage shock protein A